MQSPGLVVVGDRFDAGWQVTVDGQPAPLLSVNYLVRGVVVPEGHHAITMHYRPSSFKWGVRLFFLAATLLALLGCSALRPARIFSLLSKSG